MTVNYNNKAASAKIMLNKFGSFGYVKLRRIESNLDPVSGTDTGTTTDYDLTAVDLNITKDLLISDLVKSTDRMIIMSSDVKPIMSDTILIDNSSYKVISIMPVSPAGTDVIYKVVCRA